jgi:predicted amidophosphoribosyltransferase
MSEQPTTRYIALDDGDICGSCGKPSERDSQLCKDCIDKISGGLVDRAIDNLQAAQFSIKKALATLTLVKETGQRV